MLVLFACFFWVLFQWLADQESATLIRRFTRGACVYASPLSIFVDSVCRTKAADEGGGKERVHPRANAVE
jgi:hypothetical protein